MKKILVIGAGEIQVPIILKVKELGHSAVVVDIDPEAPGMAYADVKEAISTDNYSDIKKIAFREHVSAILTTSDYPVNIVAKLSKEFHFPAMSEHVAMLCTDKYKQRVFLKQNGINTPFFTSDPEDSQLDDFPYVVKPVDSSASRGVKKVSNRKELIDSIESASNYSRSGKIIIEKFIGGREFSIETLSQNNKTYIVAITEKLTIGYEKGYFVEDTHIQPARISDEEKELIESEVLKAIQALGVNNAPTHTEVKLFEGKCTIIEIACRLGGDFIASNLVPLSSGIDMLENLTKLSLAEEINIHPKFKKFSCIQFLNTSNYDSALSFIKLNEEFMIEYKIKDFNPDEIRSSADRLGYIILQSPTQQKLEELINKINGK